MRDEDEDSTIYKVVLNHEEQYSIWPAHRDNPAGWNDAGKEGPKQECLDHINTVWTDMRPLSLRKSMEEAAKKAAEASTDSAAEADPEPEDPGPDLVTRLCAGDSPVEVGLRSNRSVEEFRQCIDRNFVHVRFTDTRGGTELGFRLDDDTTDLSGADFEAGSGTVHVVGSLTLDGHRVRCVADIALDSLSGTGRLERLSS